MTQNTPIAQTPKTVVEANSRRWSTLLRGGYLSLLLVVPSLWSLAEADTSDLNRQLRDFPEWQLGKHLQPSFHAEIGVALADRLGARRLARRGNGELSRLLGDSPSGSVIAGRDGWLFFEESLRLMTQDDDGPIKRRRAVNVLQTSVRASGRTFRMVIAPNKATLYPDQLRAGDRRRWVERAEPKIERFRRIMIARPVPGWVEVGEGLKAKATLVERPMYEPLGSHWVDDGAVEVARLLVQSLARDLWERAVVEVVGEEDLDSDLLPVAGLEGKESFLRLKIHMPGYSVSESYKEWTESGLIRVLSSTAIPRASDSGSDSFSARNTDLLPPMVLIHDSFGPRLGELLAPFFERLAMVDYAAASSATAQRMVSESQIVVFEMAERYFFLTSGATPTSDWDAVRGLLENAGDPPLEPSTASTSGGEDGE